MARILSEITVLGDADDGRSVNGKRLRARIWGTDLSLSPKFGRAIVCRFSLAGQRIRANLELDDFALRSLSAFDVPHKVRAVVRPERAALPAGESSGRIGVVDAGVHTARIEAERIGNAHRDPL